MRIKLLAAAALFIALSASAQTTTTLHGTPPDGFKFLSNADIAKILVTPEPNRVYSASIIIDHENYFVEFVKRLDHGNMVEQHANWVDQITILSGEGVLTYGGVLSGAEQSGPGEMRGGTQTNPTTKPLHPGDFVLIPAGQPHKFDAAPGKTLNYVVFKTRV
jgi:mannose-6-phosphate isomerase-like protein (cupin superfamily)